MEGNQGSEITEEPSQKKIFVAGATGSTGERIVEQLLGRGFAVKAGVRGLDNAKSRLSKDNPALQIVKADVTDGSDKLAEAIGDDSEAVICATGFRPGWDVFAPCSLEVNGAVMGQIPNPAYIFLNVFGLTFVAKLQAERYVRKSGINYTTVRPGGLQNDPPTGNIVMEPEDTLYEGSISRDQVADVAIEALRYPESHHKVVEIVAHTDAPKRSY